MLTVATVIRENLANTLQFVAWYLEQGADRIVMVFDDVDDPAIGALRGHPRVTCIPASNDFLESVGMTRDRRFVRRQNKSIFRVYHELTEGWLLNVDGDELLHLVGRSIADELNAMPEDVRGVTFLPAEHLNTPDDHSKAHFRLSMNRHQADQVYGDVARYFRKRNGMTGHSVGKSATRAGFGKAHVRQHYLHYRDGTMLTDRVLGPPDGAYLLHFVDQGYELWRQKLPWRLGARGYAPALAGMLAEALEAGEADLKAWYDRMHVFDSVRRKALADAGVHLALDLQLDEITRRHFPDVDFGGNARVAYVA